ncbi:hypothetical protein VTJ83DRAFT_3036 [Remersonia thermophila]|uniref:chitinase n=1 Tax=Remersonia thermophila TaxID=72144 RepID=A0ABR4DCW7_9PEZI
MLFTTIDDVRARFANGTKVLVSIGGWGDHKGFETAAWNDRTRKRFSKTLAKMVEATGADGVDLDWRYPGGNTEDYKLISNDERVWEIKGYPLLLAEVRAALGPDKIISVAVPGLKRDMIAYTPETVPKIAHYVDFLNVRTYDLMNRRDNVTKHHAGVKLSLKAVDSYISMGAPPDKINLGFAFYVRWFETDHDTCRYGPLGCPTLLLEDLVTGTDLGNSGAFAWSDGVPETLGGSFTRAQSHSYGKYDKKGGGWYYWDGENELRCIWWTFDTPDAIKAKFPLIVGPRDLGGVFAWGIGEDAPHYEHFAALIQGLEKHVAGEEGM